MYVCMRVYVCECVYVYAHLHTLVSACLSFELFPLVSGNKNDFK